MKLTWWLFGVFAFGSLAITTWNDLAWLMATPVVVSENPGLMQSLLIQNILSLVQWVLIASAIICLLVQLHCLARKPRSTQPDEQQL